MKASARTRVAVALLILLCLLTQCIGFLITNGAVTYRLWTQIKPSKPFGAQEIEPVGLQAYTEEMLQGMEDVTFSSTMMLVNAAHPLPADYEPLLVEYNGARMHPDMVAPYIALRDEVQRRTGIRIYVASDYRTREEQLEILAESGSDVAAQVGCSEHEAGLALDVYAPYFGGESFLKTSAGRLVNEICADYGFVIRYPLGKEAVTGISYEPWHLRYVGAPHARLMTDSGMTMEEYLEALTPGAWYSVDGWMLSRQDPHAISLPEGWSSCVACYDQTGHLLLTVR